MCKGKKTKPYLQCDKTLKKWIIINKTHYLLTNNHYLLIKGIIVKNNSIV
jgi:hypothetical protein